MYGQEQIDCAKAVQPYLCTSEFPMPQGHGTHWEVDAAARCLRDGKLEDDMMPWEESMLIMEAMDKVREIAGLRYPESVESIY